MVVKGVVVVAARDRALVLEEWEVPWLPVLKVTVFVQIVDTKQNMWLESLVTVRNVPNVVPK